MGSGSDNRENLTHTGAGTTVNSYFAPDFWTWDDENNVPREQRNDKGPGCDKLASDGGWWKRTTS